MYTYIHLNIGQPYENAMNIKDLARIVKSYRERNGLSQGDLADRLSFTQATISRIESGKQLPRQHQLEKLLELIDQGNLPQEKLSVLKQEEELVFLENYAQLSKGEWNCFWVNRQLGSKGGDVLLVKELIKGSQLGIVIGDSVGHGKSAAYMSFALEFAYSTIASMMSPSLLTPEFFERALASGIVKTGASWRGEPSMSLIQIDLMSGVLSFINRGMPHPILLESDRPTLLSEKRASAFSLSDSTYSEGSTKKKIVNSNSVFFYTDGLLDLIEESELSSNMTKLNRLFRGDSRAIGRSLIRLLQKNSSNKKITDDVSFLILSRTKKGKANGA